MTAFRLATLVGLALPALAAPALGQSLNIDMDRTTGSGIGAPASNFAGWFVTGLAVFAVYAALDPDAPDGRDDVALALYAWIAGGETFANAALWDERVTAAAGGTAMGLFAVPALVRRVRA